MTQSAIAINRRTVQSETDNSDSLGSVTPRNDRDKKKESNQEMIIYWVNKMKIDREENSTKRYKE